MEHRAIRCTPGIILVLGSWLGSAVPKRHRLVLRPLTRHTGLDFGSEPSDFAMVFQEREGFALSAILTLLIPSHEDVPSLPHTIIHHLAI